MAIAQEGRTGAVRSYGSISGDLHALEKLMARIRHSHGIGNDQLRVVYEAGPFGYVIVRRLRQLGIDCVVIAPSMIPKKSGDKVKTDKRDAVKLARLHRAGELTSIHIDEAIRDLCRARTDAVNDQRSLRSQFKGFLLRHGYRYNGAAAAPELLVTIPGSVWKKAWVVHSQPAGSGEKALEYLSRYIYKTAISSARLLWRDDTRVAFSYRDSGTGEKRECVLLAEEFLRRFLQHVLPKRFRRVRSYGWQSPAAKERRSQVRALLG